MTLSSFAVFVQNLRDGRAHAELSAQLSELITAVRETGKTGSITLKIDVKPATRGSGVDKVKIIDTVTAKAPKPDRGEDFFYLTDDNALSRNHPRQHNLDLRDVSPSQPLTFKEATQ